MVQHTKSQPFHHVFINVEKVDEDALRKLSLCLSDFLLDRDVVSGERIYTGQMTVFVSVRTDTMKGHIMVLMTACHKHRADEITNIVYRQDLRERSSLYHIADFLETREWSSHFPDIIKSING